MCIKFKKPNEWGQIATQCVKFQWTGRKNCNDECKCLVLQGKKCENMILGQSYR